MIKVDVDHYGPKAEEWLTIDGEQWTFFRFLTNHVR